MVYLTGDTHIPHDIGKLDCANFPQQQEMTRDDYVIVLGDFGLLWQKNDRYRHWLTQLSSVNYTLLWLEGNHENHDWIDSLPVSYWHGGNVHRIADNIIHLMRGQVFDIEGKTLFTLGGALSTDKQFRVLGESWWPREELNEAEAAQARFNLKECGNSVDYILTHACPAKFARLFSLKRDMGKTGRFLDWIAENVRFKEWYFGHMHVDRRFGPWGSGEMSCLFERIERIL